MSITNKQKTAIAALVAAGLIATGTVLFLGRSTEGNESAREAAEHAESAGHQDREHHGEPSQGKHED
ncbi:efflux transporter periplasmic adaptor subunit, partial [Escherichia coli]|nr:efflux transporter periplasmic adaptor subunit [Escherichia coli]